MIARLSEFMTQQVGAANELSKALGGVREMSQSITAATAEQTANAKQVSRAVENVNELTQAAASAAEQMLAATEQLASMAQRLQKTMAQFKVRETEKTAAEPIAARLSGSADGKGDIESQLRPTAQGLPA